MLNPIKKTYIENQNLIPDTFWQVIQVCGKQGYLFGVFFIAAHFLNPYDFGIYNYALAILMLIVLFGDFGVSAATSKYVAEFNTTDKERLKSVLFNATAFIAVFLVFIFLLLIFFGPLILRDKYHYILYLLPSLFFLPLTYLYIGIYRGLNRFKSSSWRTLVGGCVSLVIAYPLIKYFGIYGALWSNNIFAITLFILLFFGYREWSVKFDPKLIKMISTYSLVLGIVSLSYYLYSRTDIILLGQFGYMNEIGFYEFINKIFLLLVSPFMILAQVLSPQITRMYVLGDIKKIIYKFKQFVFLSLIVSLVLSVALFFILPFIIDKYLFAYSNLIYVKAFYYLLIILITQSIAAIVATGFSIATGHARLNMYFLIIFGIINIPFTYILINNYGFIGAIYSTVIIRCLTDILFICSYYFLLKKELTKQNNCN